MDVKRGSLRSNLRQITGSRCHTPRHTGARENNHTEKLKASVLQSDDKNKKLIVTTDDADTKARRMGDIFLLLCPKIQVLAVLSTMAVAVATLC